MNNKRKRCPICGKYFDKILEYKEFFIFMSIDNELFVFQYFDKILEYKEFIIYRHEDKEKCSAVYSDPIKIIKSNN